MKGQGNRTNKTNGHRRSNSRYNGNNYQDQFSVNQEAGNDKLLSKITRSISKTCIATLSNGKKYQGLLTNADLSTNGSSPLSIVLMNAVLKDKNVNEKAPEKLVIQATDLINLEVVESDLQKQKKTDDSALRKQSISSESTFRTDGDISGGRLQFKERELKRWVPEDDGKNPLLQLEENTDGGRWDQFKVNEDKFGVESSYDEHLYTTRIDTSAPDYEEKLRKAEKLAKEIEGQTSTNYHILEERGITVDDSGIDEEDKYSGVDRRGDELLAALRGTNISSETPDVPIVAPGKYAHPRQRAAQYHNDPAIISSSATSSTKRSNVPEPRSTDKAQKPPVMPTINKPDSIPPKPVVQKQHNESFRLNAQSEINSLREFSANFKIPHKMPQDLLPILAKDTSKQDEILKKQHGDQKPKCDNDNQTDSQRNQKKKSESSKPSFKLNPKAAAFTPLNMQVSPNPPKSNFNKISNSQSPRMNNQRPNLGSNGGTAPSSAKRHHQISPMDFFGGAALVPSKTSQEEKTKLFKTSFNMFITTRKTSEKSNTSVVFQKTFQTPPTWEATIDESYVKLYPSIQLPKGPGMRVPGAQFIPSPMMSAPNLPGSYATGKFPISPQQQQAATAAMAAHFQQQQFQAAMMYQQQLTGGMLTGQPMPMYPGAETPFMPPNYIAPPGNFASATGSPVNGNMILNNESYSGNNYNNHGGNRRYNNSQNNHKKGSNQ